MLINQFVTKDEKKSTEEIGEPWTPYIPEKPSRVMCGFHAKEEGKFWLSMVSVSVLIFSMCFGSVLF